ncbi:hypothetical protein PR048_022551 [Dryococelus australis]|uniref:CCHC-type domain-containing protein n=1 Tax=Dryococelus australis TaxID=614101 RepID=A0ABQ9H1A5_9NEOP|nr:hypothetical protein PR048_022551 [Dryococelus australis]
MSSTWPNKIRSLGAGMQTDSHTLIQCQSFLSCKPDEKRRHVLEKRVCFNCLRGGHIAVQCVSRFQCQHCGELHHTLLPLADNGGKVDTIPDTDNVSAVGFQDDAADCQYRRRQKSADQQRAIRHAAHWLLFIRCTCNCSTEQLTDTHLFDKSIGRQKANSHYLLTRNEDQRSARSSRDVRRRGGQECVTQAPTLGRMSRYCLPGVFFRGAACTHGTLGGDLAILLVERLSQDSIHVPIIAFDTSDQVSLDRRMNKVTRLMAVLFVHKEEEYITWTQVDLKQGFQKCSLYREQPILAVATLIKEVYKCPHIILVTSNALKVLLSEAMLCTEPVRSPAGSLPGFQQGGIVPDEALWSAGFLGDLPLTLALAFHASLASPTSAAQTPALRLARHETRIRKCHIWMTCAMGTNRKNKIQADDTVTDGRLFEYFVSKDLKTVSYPDLRDACRHRQFWVSEPASFLVLPEAYSCHQIFGLFEDPMGDYRFQDNNPEPMTLRSFGMRCWLTSRSLEYRQLRQRNNSLVSDAKGRIPAHVFHEL